MHTIIKIAVVSVLSPVCYRGVVSISKAEENKTGVEEVTAEEKKILCLRFIKCSGRFDIKNTKAC